MNPTGVFQCSVQGLVQSSMMSHQPRHGLERAIKQAGLKTEQKDREIRGHDRERGPLSPDLVCILSARNKHCY